MLNTSEIAQRIDSPQRVGSDDLAALKELSEKYPYTPLFSILYLKGLRKTRNIDFDEELKKHSYRIGDRVQLYELIQMNELEQENQPDQSSYAEEEVTSNAHAEEEIARKETTIEVEEEVPASEDGVLTQANNEMDAEDVSHEIAIDKDEHDIAALNDTEETAINDIPEDAVDENILHHAVVANYTLEELTEEESLALNRRIVEKEQEVANEENEDSNELDEFDSTRTFTSWLSADSNHEETINEDKEAINAVVNDFADFDPSEGLFGEVDKPKQEFFSPTKKAKESLDEGHLPVSETLAKIYVAQGNYPKAIEAYSQLSLKYPEKKIFFANLIKDLQKKINS